jgi:hypothetical protein
MMAHYAMLHRNVLYTGVTRGKKLAVLVGQKKTIAIAVRDVAGRRRWSKLGEWLASKRSDDFATERVEGSLIFRNCLCRATCRVRMPDVLEYARFSAPRLQASLRRSRQELARCLA